MLESSDVFGSTVVIKESLKLIDFSYCKVLDINLKGAAPKKCIQYLGDRFILKFRTKDGLPYVSEYVASKIAGVLDIPCQEVLLGRYKGEPCCAIRFITGEYEELRDYKSLVQYLYGETKLSYDIATINKVLSDFSDEQLDVNETYKSFQYMCLLDALLGNFDRHHENWGLVRSIEGHEFRGIFDNGSSLYPRIHFNDISRILNSKGEMNSRVEVFPESVICVEESQTGLKKPKSSYSDLVKGIISFYGDSVFMDFYNKLSLVDFESLLFEDESLREFVSEDYLKFLEAILTLRIQILFKGVYDERLSIQDR